MASEDSGSGSDESSQDDVVEALADVVDDFKNSVNFEGETELSFHPCDPNCSDEEIQKAMLEDAKKLEVLVKEAKHDFFVEVKRAKIPQKYHPLCWPYLLHVAQGGKQSAAEALNEFDEKDKLPEHRDLGSREYLRRLHKAIGEFIEEPAAKRARTE